MEFYLVPHSFITRTLPHLVKFLEKSEYWSNGRASIDDIVGFLYSGQMNLWVGVYEGGIVVGYLMTEVKQYPKKKLLNVQYCAADTGVLDKAGEKIFGILEQFARDGGCSGIEFFGRPGWAPHAKSQGFDTRTVVYEKHFEV